VYWRRDRLPAITVRSDLKDGVQAPVVSQQLEAKMAPMRAKLPAAYRIDTGGAIEDAGKGQKSDRGRGPGDDPRDGHRAHAAAAELLAPGAGAAHRAARPHRRGRALLVFNVPFGFVAMLGTIALAGMIMRNSVILVDQIDRTSRRQRARRRDRRRHGAALPADHAHGRRRDAGHDPAHAQRLLRADGGGDHGRLVVATVLTLLFLPALYAAWFKVPSQKAESRSRAMERGR
jgi:multidrug efflux pump